MALLPGETVVVDESAKSDTTASLLDVVSKDTTVEGVSTITLAHSDGRRLPDWAPGAHIDVFLPAGQSRQYSLCGDRFDPYSYRISVRLADSGRGGSAFVSALRVGDSVRIGGPRNNFRLAPAPRYLFVAGGIGITPLMPMIAQAELMDIDWQLIYLGRRRETMALLEELTVYQDRVIVHPSSTHGRFDLLAAVAAEPPSTKVYGCGPESLLDAVEIASAGRPIGGVRIERFVAREQTTPVRTTPFVVELARTGTVVSVDLGTSVLAAVRSVGGAVLASCLEGTCGTCETTVLAGIPDHRDSILDDAERAAEDCMFPCVSRSCSDRLVLDI